MKEKLKEMYDMLDNVMNIDGDWKSIIDHYEDVMSSVMNMILETIEDVKEIERRL